MINLRPETLQKIDEVIPHYPVKRSAASRRRSAGRSVSFSILFRICLHIAPKRPNPTSLKMAAASSEIRVELLISRFFM